MLRVLPPQAEVGPGAASLTSLSLPPSPGLLRSQGLNVICKCQEEGVTFQEGPSQAPGHLAVPFPAQRAARDGHLAALSFDVLELVLQLRSQT